ncbi:MAG: hypothetical protein DMG79_16915 [Acidobacteria bacterium]|nr:MAG: hypothetical protein DMG79_16915 [Acidobacteriota bacterium]
MHWITACAFKRGLFFVCVRQNNGNGKGNSNFKDNVKGSGQECPLYTIFTYFASVTCSRDSL